MNFWDHSHLMQSDFTIIDHKNGQAWNYAKLCPYINQLNLLVSRFKRKTFGILLCANNVESIICYLTCLQNGHAVLLLNEKIAASFINNLIEIYRPDWVFTSNCEVINIASFVSCSNVLNYFFFRLRSPLQERDAIYSDLALLLVTSGSTGDPKLVRLSYRNLSSNASSIADYLKLTSIDRPITILPIYYSYGLSIINSHMLVGATILLTEDSVCTKKFWKFATANDVSSLSGVPLTYQLLKSVNIENISLNNLTYLTQAGGKLGENLIRYFHRISHDRDWRFYIMYGQTEATARISYLPPENLNEKIGSIGVAIPGGKLSIDSFTSELIYEGPNVMLGYATEYSDLSRGDDCSGILKTGDIARKDSDGYYYIVGRSSRFAKVAGVRYNLDNLENKLIEYSDCFLACLSDDRRFYIFLENTLKIDEIKSIMVNKFGINHNAIQFLPLEESSINSNNKINYKILKDKIVTKEEDRFCV